MRHCSCLLFCTDNNKMGTQSFSSCFEIHGTVIIHLCQLFLPSPSVNNSMYGDVLSKWYRVTTKEKYGYPYQEPRSTNIVSLQFLVSSFYSLSENMSTSNWSLSKKHKIAKNLMNISHCHHLNWWVTLYKDVYEHHHYKDRLWISNEFEWLLMRKQFIIIFPF